MYFGVQAGIGGLNSNRDVREQDSFAKTIGKGAMMLGAGAALAYGGKGAYNLAKKAYGDDVAKQAFNKGKSVVKDKASQAAASVKKRYAGVSASDAVGGGNTVSP